MKKNILFFIALTFSVAIIYLSCKKDKCKDVVCQNNGTCNEGTCVCPNGYSGTNCETKDPCLDVVCLNGGTCSNGKCTCPTDYIGDDCSVFIGCNPPCQNGGTCSTGTCICDAGYYGADCSISCTNCSPFTGTYSTSKEYCNAANTYNCTVSISTTANNKLVISNFNNRGWTVYADVLSSNTLTIPAQYGFIDANTNVPWTVASTQSISTLSGNTLTLFIVLTNENTGNPVSCAVILAK